MSILSALGLGKKVRYGVVGLGDIAQGAFLPGVGHTGNSEVTALVSGDRAKAREVARRYDVAETYSYEEYPELLKSGRIDAVYIATPNWRHAEFAIPALQAGIHVLCEKPLEVSAKDGEAILAAARASSAKLMVAYRLHFEPATLDAIRKIRAGLLGDLVSFTSVFGQMADPANHRGQNGDLAGPLLDMGAYPINAARYLFDDEPIAVEAAVATRHPDSGLKDMDDTVAVTLRFPGDKLAQFTVSYYLNAIDTLAVAGTKGSIALTPAFGYQEALTQTVQIGDTRREEGFKATDHFGGELRYFSDCILNGRDPEPDGMEGMADLHVTDAIFEALRTGGRVEIDRAQRPRRIDPDAQEQRLSAVSRPETVGASPPTRQ